MPPSLKNRLRALARLLNKKDLPDDVRRTKEKELEELRETVKERQKQLEEERKIEKITKKYKSIRFFERRKIERRIAQLKRKLAGLFTADGQQSSEEQELRQRLDQLQEDLEYVKHFPRGVRYVALFPARQQNDMASLAEVDRIRQVIKAQRSACQVSQQEAKDEEKEEEKDSEEGDEQEGDFFLQSESESSGDDSGEGSTFRRRKRARKQSLAGKKRGRQQ